MDRRSKLDLNEPEIEEEQEAAAEHEIEATNKEAKQEEGLEQEGEERATEEVKVSEPAARKRKPRKE